MALHRRASAAPRATSHLKATRGDHRPPLPAGRTPNQAPSVSESRAPPCTVVQRSCPDARVRRSRDAPLGIACAHPRALHSRPQARRPRVIRPGRQLRGRQPTARGQAQPWKRRRRARPRAPARLRWCLKSNPRCLLSTARPSVVPHGTPSQALVPAALSPFTCDCPFDRTPQANVADKENQRCQTPV